MLSSLFGLQYVMTFSLIVGNYGGWLDSLSISLYSAYLRTLWMNIQSLFSIRYHGMSSGLLIPKYQYLGYLRSPLSQHWLELLVFGWVLLRILISSKSRNYTEQKKEENLRAISLASMALFYPLVKCSVFSLLTIFIVRIYTFFGLLTLVLSLALLFGLSYIVMTSSFNIKYDHNQYLVAEGLDSG